MYISLTPFEFLFVAGVVLGIAFQVGRWVARQEETKKVSRGVSTD